MRKLATAAAVSLVLASSGAYALGLGDIEMQSALNQPMDAEIPLVSAKGDELDGMIVQLASSEAFARAGIDRSSVLTDLKFEVDVSTGQPVIRISSSRPVVEPFLNFLLEVDWPQGRMVREYTVLLDPPVFMTPSATARNSSSDQPARLERDSQALVAPTPIQRDNPADEGFDVEIVGGNDELGDDQLLGGSDNGDVVSLDGLLGADSAGEVVTLTDLGDSLFEVEVIGGDVEVGDDVISGTVVQTADDESEVVSLEELDFAVDASEEEFVPVKPGDTLFEIAEENPRSGVSVQQMMMALLNANQSAFINQNVNLVKAGSTLRVPQAPEASLISRIDAINAIGAQTQLWREYRDNLRNSNATRLAETAPTPEVPAEEPLVEDIASDLSEDARAILESARNEIQNRDELRIVADNDSTSSNASATSNQTDSEGGASALGEINRQLQLAREELASSRVEGNDLGEQVSELESTGENLDALVSLRQNEVARLESQLEGLRTTQDEAAAEAEALAIAALDVPADVAPVEGDIVVVPEGTEITIAEPADNALTAAGETLEQVEAFEPEIPEEEVIPVPVPEVQTAWYQDLLKDPTRLAIAGVGVLGLLGLGGLLLRRRRKDDDDERLDFDDEVEFIDDEEAGGLQREIDAEQGKAGFAAVAGGAAAAGIAGLGGEDSQPVVAPHEVSDDGDDTVRRSPVTSGDNKDDTLSEVDVYLAYGLHGQAEEILNKAIEANPDNSEYANKLLATYHAQGNSDGFHRLAEDFHTRFGGDQSSEWPGIAAMGQDLQPGNPLYAIGAETVQSVGIGDFNGPKLSDDDFGSSSDDASTSGSISREFGKVEADAVDFTADDEESLMDQSIDPGFAFDEGDLEATGDFSEIANELAGEEEGSIDFDGFGSSETDVEALLDMPTAPDVDASELDLAAVAETASDDIDMVDFDAGALTGDVPDTGADLFSEVDDPMDGTMDFGDDALSLDELDVSNVAGAANDSSEELDLSAVADDLTLDLEQLSGDMDIDSAELLGDSMGTVGELDMPDLSADNDLLGTGAEGSDEMETMMDLAKAYIDMGDKDSASSALGEIVKSGSPEQVSEAETLLRKIS